jgi:hypothetical protein
MPRDHYIAETYLKHFLGNDGFLHVYRKSDGKYFPARPRAICHEWDGDIIQDFLANPKMLGDYRRLFEAAWNPAVTQLATGRVSRENKLAIAGYLANLLVCTPHARRLVGALGILQNTPALARIRWQGLRVASLLMRQL